MEKFIKTHRLLAGSLSIVISVFMVSIVAYGATTIGTNVTTEGYATSTVGLYTQGVLDVGGNGLIRGKATTTTAFAVGSGTIDHLNMAGGDLYVLDDVEIDGLATSTEGFYSMGVLEIGGNGLVRGKATTTTAFAVGSGTINHLDMAGGDLYVQNDAEIDGGLYVNSATTTDSLVVGGYISTTGDISTSGAITSTGSTTASVINMTTIKFTPSATPTSDVVGECFIDNNDWQLNCYDGSAWQQAW